MEAHQPQRHQYPRRDDWNGNPLGMSLFRFDFHTYPFPLISSRRISLIPPPRYHLNLSLSLQDHRLTGLITRCRFSPPLPGTIVVTCIPQRSNSISKGMKCTESHKVLCGEVIKGPSSGEHLHDFWKLVRSLAMCKKLSKCPTTVAWMFQLHWVPVDGTWR
ncbi:hypothetical protein VTO42DRAFT_2758 [Malbranchea cinnamomea]